MFFVKKKTAYERRSSDWSSDVCSSDLRGLKMARKLTMAQRRILTQMARGDFYHQTSGRAAHAFLHTSGETVRLDTSHALWRRGFVAGVKDRSEERRGGEECVGTWRFRWSKVH